MACRYLQGKGNRTGVETRPAQCGPFRYLNRARRLSACPFQWEKNMDNIDQYIERARYLLNYKSRIKNEKYYMNLRRVQYNLKKALHCLTYIKDVALQIRYDYAISELNKKVIALT